jgi:dienelactone hydrolase
MTQASWRLLIVLAFFLGIGAQLLLDKLFADPPSEPQAPDVPHVEPELPSAVQLAPGLGVFDAPRSYITLPERIDDVWRSKVRDAVVELLQPRPLDDRPTPAEHLGGRIHEGVTLKLFRLTMNDGQQIRAMLLVPPGPSPRSLVLALHGHDRVASGLDLLLLQDTYQKGIALQLAKRGHLVLAVETRGFGGSPTSDLPHAIYVERLRLQGHEFHGEVLSDNREALRFVLDAHPAVEHVGVVGASMGGLSALFLSLFEPRVETALLSGAVGSFRGAFSSSLHCPCSLIAGVLRRLDIPQMIAASHAQSIGVEAGLRDDVLGSENLKLIRDQLEKSSQSGGPKIGVYEFDGGHEHDLPFVLDFFEPLKE